MAVWCMIAVGRDRQWGCYLHSARARGIRVCHTEEVRDLRKGKKVSSGEIMHNAGGRWKQEGNPLSSAVCLLDSELTKTFRPVGKGNT